MSALLLVLVLPMISCLIVTKPMLSTAQVIENTWVVKMPMPKPSSAFGVAVVNGKVYAMGGFPNLNSNQEYDPATDSWREKSAMPTGRFGLATAVFQNKIYCIGGLVADVLGPSNTTGAIEVYDPVTDKWEIRKPMPEPRAHLEANVVNGKIYLIGGKRLDQYSTVSLNEVYDPETESWTKKVSMPYPVASYASAVVGNRIFVLGGQDEFNETMNLAVNQIFDTETDTWTFGAPLPTVVWRSAAGAVSGTAAWRIYLVGGQPGNTGGATNITQVYDPERDSWSFGASMPTARFDLALAVLDSRLYAIGGTERYIFPNEKANAENEMYIPFGCGAIEPKPTEIVPDPQQTESFPTALVVFSVVTVALVGAGLLLYRRKRHREAASP